MDSRPLKALVRRREADSAIEGSAPFTSDTAAIETQQNRVFSVSAAIAWPLITTDGSLKGPPHIRLSWRPQPGRQATIAGFRRQGGFGRDGDWGDRIVTCAAAGAKEEHLPAGEYFYTFCTVSEGVFCRTYHNEIQFAQTIPSIEAVLKLMDQAIDFEKKQRRFKKQLAKNRPAAPRPAPKALDFEGECRSMLDEFDAYLGASQRLRAIVEERKAELMDGPGTEDDKRQALRRILAYERNFLERLQTHKKGTI